MSDLDFGTRDLIRKYYPLEGAIAPLVEIAKVQPIMLEQVIEFAMVMGIHAEERRVAKDLGAFKALKDRLPERIW